MSKRPRKGSIALVHQATRPNKIGNEEALRGLQSPDCHSPHLHLHHHQQQQHHRRHHNGIFAHPDVLSGSGHDGVEIGEDLQEGRVGLGGVAEGNQPQHEAVLQHIECVWLRRVRGDCEDRQHHRVVHRGLHTQDVDHLRHGRHHLLGTGGGGGGVVAERGRQGAADRGKQS